MDKVMTYLDQINKFYARKLKPYQVINVCDTPKYLEDLHMSKLPIVLKQSTLAKCVREPKGSRSAHDLDRNIVEALPKQIENPILAIEEKGRKSFALISDFQDKEGKNILIAIKMNVMIQNIMVNEIISVYGRGNLEIYLSKHDPKEIHVIDSNKAKHLASLLRLQLPTTLQVLDYEAKLTQGTSKVNDNFQVFEKRKMMQKESVLQKIEKYQQEIDVVESKDNSLESQQILKER